MNAGPDTNRLTPRCSRARMANDQRLTTNDGFLLRRRLDHFDVEGDGDVVAGDAGSAGHSEIQTIDFGGGGCAHAEVARGLFQDGSGSVHVEDNFLRDAVNGEIAGDL